MLTPRAGTKRGEVNSEIAGATSHGAAAGVAGRNREQVDCSDPPDVSNGNAAAAPLRRLRRTRHRRRHTPSPPAPPRRVPSPPCARRPCCRGVRRSDVSGGAGWGAGERKATAKSRWKNVPPSLVIVRTRPVEPAQVVAIRAPCGHPLFVELPKTLGVGARHDPERRCLLRGHEDEYV